MATYTILRRFYNGGRILDIGGWPGDFACTLADLSLPVTVVDKDSQRPTMKQFNAAIGVFEVAESVSLYDKCQQHGIEVFDCNIETTRLPFDDDSFDFIVFTEVIEHLRVSPLHALREIRRLLSPDGVVLISTPNLLSLRNRISFAFGNAKYDTLSLPYDALIAEEVVGHGGHFRVYSMPELHDLLTRTGFRVIHCEYRNLLTADREQMKPSFYAARIKIGEWLKTICRPLRDTIFFVVQRDDTQQ